MPQDSPKLSPLSKPVEPQFLKLLNKIVLESFEYGKEKYGIPLHSFNGRSELQDFAEEWVSGGRYVVQLAMRCHKLEELLIGAYGILSASPAGNTHVNQPLMEEIREAIAQACGDRK